MNTPDPTNVFKNAFVITRQLKLPVVFDLNKLRVIRFIFREAYSIEKLFERIDRQKLYPLTLNELILLSDIIIKLNTSMFNLRKPVRKPGKESKTSEEKRRLELGEIKTQLELVYNRLNHLFNEDGSTLPNYSMSAIFCGTEMCAPDPRLSILRFYPTIGCGSQEAKYLAIGTVSVPSGNFAMLDVACMDK